MAQKQDLIVFQDYSILPKTSGKNIVFLTYSLGTSPSWLTQALIEECLFGEAASLNEKRASKSTGSGSGITIASFLHNQEFLEKNYASKLKLKNTQNKKVELVDLTNCLQTDDFKAVLQKMDNKNGNKTLLLEQPEILLATNASLSANSLNMDLIDPLFQFYDTIIIISNLDFYSSFPKSPIDLQFNKFIQSLFYKCIVNLNIKPLSTGRAHDVTGTLSIVKGGQGNCTEKALTVVENEYLFNIQKESAKLFYR